MKKEIFERMNHLKNQTLQISTSYNIKNYSFLRYKLSDKGKILKELKTVDNDMIKTKSYLLSLIQRLENIECILDKHIDRKMKEKSKKI